MKKIYLLLSVLLALALFGCGGDSSQQSGASSKGGDADSKGAEKASASAEGSKLPAAPKGVFRINLRAEPPTIDPNLATDVSGATILIHLFEPLLRLDEHGKSVGAAAEKWEHDAEFKTWTFHLRRDGKWSNGDPVTANDWVFSIQRILDKKTTAKYAMLIFNTLEGGKAYYDSDDAAKKLDSVRAIDDYTLEIKLANPTPYLPGMLSHQVWFPIHRGTVEKYGAKWIDKPETFVCNGPYKLTEIRPKDRLILTKNPNFWDAKNVKFSELQMLFISGPAPEIAAYMSGDLDMTSIISNREAPTLKSRPDFVNYPMLGAYFLSFNVTRPPFDDIALRRAMSLTINRKMIVENLVKRGENPAAGLIPRGLTLDDGRDYRDAAPKFIDSAKYAENVKEAKDILAKAGYGKDKQFPRIEYLFNSEDSLHKDIAEALQNIWKGGLGITVDLQNVEWKVALARGASHDFQMLRSSWIGDYLDPMTFLEIFETGHGNNYTGYSNKEYDGLLAKIRSETDPAKRLEYIVAAERKLVVEDCVIAPVFEYTSPVLLRSEIKGVVSTPLGIADVSRAYRQGE